MQDKLINILIVTAWYKNESLPFSGSFVEEQARMLQKKGHKVTVLHAYLTGTYLETLKSPKVVSSITNDNGITTVRVGVKPFLPKARTMSYNRLNNTCLKILKGELNINSFDLIHCHSLFMGGVVGHFLSEKLKKPFILTEHTSSLLFKPQQYTKNDIKKLHLVYNEAKAVFFVSSYAKDKMIRNYSLKQQNKYHILGNVVDDSFFSVQPSRGNFSYLMIGGLIPIKNHLLLLSAWKILLKNYPYSILTLSGEGHLESELKEFTNKQCISHSIKWLPKLSRKEVKEVIDRHHVLLSTSLLETFGLTVAEAQASGKPVVVTNSGGVRDIVSKQSGFITSFEAEQYAKALTKVQSEYDKFNSELISKECASKFSSEVIYSQLLIFYNQISQ